MAFKPPNDSPPRFNPFRDYARLFHDDIDSSPSLISDSHTGTPKSEPNSSDDEVNHDVGHDEGPTPYSSLKHKVSFVKNKDRIPKWVFRQSSCNVRTPAIPS